LSYICGCAKFEPYLHPLPTYDNTKATKSNTVTKCRKYEAQQSILDYFTHIIILLLVWNLSGTTRVSRYQKGKTRKGKTNLDLLEQEIVSGSGICLAVCKSAPHPRQPRQHPTTQFFTGRMPFMPPNQQRQSTEGTLDYFSMQKLYLDSRMHEKHHLPLKSEAGPPPQ